MLPVRTSNRLWFAVGVGLPGKVIKTHLIRWRLAPADSGLNLLDMVLDCLSEREARILRMRFGVGEPTSRTLDEVG